MEYFLFQRYFAILWGVQFVSVNYSSEQMLLVGELISTYHQNEAQRFKNKYFGIFLN